MERGDKELKTRCVKQDRRRSEPKDSSRVRVPEKEEAGASGRVEWVVVGSDGLVRNAKGGAGLLQPI
jgi:hypothetical protein